MSIYAGNEYGILRYTSNEKGIDNFLRHVKSTLDERKKHGSHVVILVRGLIK